MRRALLVGIDGYPDAPLSTCVNDAKRMGEVLKRNADMSVNWVATVKVARDSSVQSILRGDLQWELSELFDSRDDDVLFYFSGHAVVTPWGAELSTQEGAKPGLGFSFSNLTTLVNSSKAKSVTVILDCCFAGDLATSLPGGPLGLGQYETATLRENAVILAAAGESQRVLVGEQALSPFTSLLVNGLLGGASDQRGRVNALALYSHAWSAMVDGNAKPQLKANCAELPILRTSTPWARLESFHKLTSLFEKPHSAIKIALDELGDASVEPSDRFRVLSELNAARLLEIDGVHSVEWAARTNLQIRLNRMGRYHWRQVYRGAM